MIHFKYFEIAFFSATSLRVRMSAHSHLLPNSVFLSSSFSFEVNLVTNFLKGIANASERKGLVLNGLYKDTNGISLCF